MHAVPAAQVPLSKYQAPLLCRSRSRDEHLGNRCQTRAVIAAYVPSSNTSYTPQAYSRLTDDPLGAPVASLGALPVAPVQQRQCSSSHSRSTQHLRLLPTYSFWINILKWSLHVRVPVQREQLIGLKDTRKLGIGIYTGCQPQNLYKHRAMLRLVARTLP